VLGAAGFGVEMGPEGPVVFPQNGTVVVGDDVRIGANSTVDRATFGATRVGSETKIDNLVQVSHNVTIGRGVLICALAGVGGGARFGDRSILGPQGALAPEADLGPATILGPRAALIEHQRLHAPGEAFMDGPPMPVQDWLRWSSFRIRTGKARGRRSRGG
jgi:UDP-3-O-[3-hydroxymyristoyl] glucosamine N-acyltransferase